MIVYSFILNDHSEYHKILSFPSCPLLNQSKPSAYTVKVDNPAWNNETIKNIQKGLNTSLVNRLKNQKPFGTSVVIPPAYSFMKPKGASAQ